MVLVLILVPMSVFADNFVPSISYKGAPEIVPIDPANGIIATVTGTVGNDEHDSKVKGDCIVITPVSEANTSPDIPDDAAILLLRVYNELLEQDTKLSDLSDELNQLVEAKLGNGKDADDLVVKDLFDVSVICDKLEASLAPEGNTLDLTFKLGVDADEEVFIMTYKNDVWSPAENVVNNGDGTVTGTFEHFCPVAILVEGQGSSHSPETGVFDVTYLWAIVAVVSAALIVVVAVSNSRASKKTR